MPKERFNFDSLNDSTPEEKGTLFEKQKIIKKQMSDQKSGKQFFSP